MSKHYFHIDYKFTHVLDIGNSDFPNVDEISGKIIYNDYENETSIEIGEIELHLYNFAFIDYGFTLWDAFDRSANTSELGEAILDNENDHIKLEILDQIGSSHDLNILVIHNFILYAGFRSKGYGKEIMKGIECFFNGKCGIIALQSFPKQHDITVKNSTEFEKFKFQDLDKNIISAKKSLNQFYENCGFIKIHYENNCYIKNIAPM